MILTDYSSDLNKSNEVVFVPVRFLAYIINNGGDVGV